MVERAAVESCTDGLSFDRCGRDILTADNALAGFEGFDIIANYGLTAEQVFGGDFWRPGVDRQITPWTSPNIYGYPSLDTVPAGVLASGLQAIDDIRQGAGNHIDFDYYPSLPEADVVYVRENWWVTSRTNDTALFNELRVEPGARLQIDAGAILTINTRLVVEEGAFLNVEGTLRFGPEARLVVYGTATATGAFLVALDPVAGWRGVRLARASGETFAQQPPLTWTNTTVSDVALDTSSETGPDDPAAVVVFERDFRMLGGRIERTRGGAGLYTAQGAALVSNAAEILANEGVGLLAGPSGIINTGLASIGGSGVTIQGNLGGGVSASGTNAFVHLLKATVDQNFGPGAAASGGGWVYLLQSAQSVVSGNYGGLSATSGGIVYAGECQTSGGQTTCDVPPNGHSFPGNTQEGLYFDARSLTGSVLYAEGNRWGDITDPKDLILISDPTSYLSVCPFSGGDASLCGSASAPSVGRPGREALPIAETDDEASTRTSVLSAPLFARASALLATGDTLAAGAVLLGALDGATTEDGRVAAYQAAARLVARARPAALMVRLAQEASADGDPLDRPWALRALVVARAATRETPAAHAAATALVGAYAGTEHAVAGYAARVRLAVGARDESAALEAFDALRALADAGGEVAREAAGAAAIAGALVAAAFGQEEGAGARYARREATPQTEKAGATSRAAGADAPAEIEVGRVRPNPTAGQATLVVGLPDAAAVTTEVYDALGRRVRALVRLDMAAGYHRLDLDARTLAQGTYVARVRIAVPGGPARVETRRFVVVR